MDIDDLPSNSDALYRHNLALRQAYAAIFANGGDAAQIVLEDLRAFCRGSVSTLAINPVTNAVDVPATMAAEGRREVWLRLCDAINRDPHTGASL